MDEAEAAAGAVGRGITREEEPLSPAELEAIERSAIEIVHAAGERALAAFRGTLELEFKGPRHDDPVTAADRETEAFLRAELRRRYPGHGLVGEEQADDVPPGARLVWAIDPLDGTANFAAGLPLWGVSLGLLDAGVPVVGCIWVPAGFGGSPGAYHARAGGGAWFEERRLTVAEGDDERGRLLALPGRYWRTFRFRRTEPRRGGRGADARALGSIAVEMALLAGGSFQAAVFVQPKIWDVAAGALLVREAGGLVLAWQDHRWQPFSAFEARPPPDGKGEPALRHWTRPLLCGPPARAERAAAALAWHPRLPQRVRRLLGLEQS